MKSNKHCVYFHLIPKTKIVFYVGIGDKYRPFEKGIHERTKFWHNEVNKHGIEIVIKHNNISKFTACKLEKFYIKKFGRRDLGLGTLVNLTDGGETPAGYKHTEEWKINKSEEMSDGRYDGDKNPFYKGKFTEEALEKIKPTQFTTEDGGKFGEDNHMFGKTGDKHHLYGVRGKWTQSEQFKLDLIKRNKENNPNSRENREKRRIKKELEAKQQVELTRIKNSLKHQY